MQALENGMTLLDAFPFDSSPNLVYTNQGYPRGDRAVDAWTMRSTFRQFFSTGVFGTPANAFEISKGTGLTVTVQPGMCVIEGGMGGISEKSGPLTLTLGTGPAQGKTPYGIMLRYDDNSDVRGITVYAKKGTPGDDPVPPEPDTTSANVHELRLGYVIVPNGASDLSEATVTNEKGTSVCPYAAPFVPLDLDSIVADARTGATEALQSLLAYFEQYRDAIDAALSDEEATYLQQQITAIQQQLSNFDLSGSVDNETIQYSVIPGDVAAKLHVADGGISSDKLAGGAVTQDKLAGPVAAGIMPAQSIADSILLSNGSAASWVALSEALKSMLTRDSVQLWSGSASTSEITVPNIGNYSIFKVYCVLTGNHTYVDGKTFCLAVRVGGNLVGMGILNGLYAFEPHDSSYNNVGFWFFASISGETLSPVVLDNNKKNVKEFVYGGEIRNSAFPTNCGQLKRIDGVC